MAKKYDDLLKKVDQNIQNQKEYLQMKPLLDSPYSSVFEKLGIIQRVDNTPKTIAHTQGEFANPGNNIQQNYTPRGIEYGLSDNPRLGHNFEASQTGNQTLDDFFNQLQNTEQQRQAQAEQEQARRLAEQQRQANQQNRVNSRLNQIDRRDNASGDFPAVNVPQNTPIPENVMDLIATQVENERNPYLPTAQVRRPYNSWLQGMRAYQDENGNIIRDEEGNSYHIPINRESDGYNAHTVSDTGINAIDKIVDAINYANARGANAFDTFNDALNTLGTGIFDSIKGAKGALGTGKEAGGVKLPNLGGFDTAGRKPVFQSSTGESGAVKSQEEFNEAKGASNVLGKAQEGYLNAIDKAAKENNRPQKSLATEKKYAVVASNPVVKSLGDLNEAIAGQLPYVAMNAIPGVGQVLAPAMRGLTSSINAYEEARAEGASKTQAQRYAGREAINQSVGEVLIEGIAGLDGGILGKTLSRTKMGRALAKAYGTHITAPALKTAIKYFGTMLGEGAEEALQDVVSAANKRATYDPNAKVSAKELAYSGLLGGLMAGVFNAPNVPSDYRAYRSDFDTVNSMSQAAAAVKSQEEARFLNLQIDTLIDECNINLGEYAAPVNETDFDMRARYEYIKNGLQTIKDTLNSDLDAIIENNTKFNDAVTNIANAPADNIVNETASLVAAVADTVEPEEDVVKATIDRVNEEIQDINATEQDIRGMSDAEFADWWYNARFKNAFPGLVDAMNHVPNNLLTSGDALAQQIAERNARYQQNSENNARFDNEAGLHIDAYKQGVITQLEMQKNILANIDSVLRNQKNEVKNAVTDLLTPNANGDTIETKNPVVQADGESLAPAPSEPTAPDEPKYIMKRGTYSSPGTNETYDVIQKPRNLSKQEYAELKKAVMDNGGMGWNKAANGFLIRPGRMDDVRKALEKIGVGVEVDTPTQTATETRPAENVRTPNETVPQFEVAGSTTETLTGERGDIPQFEVVGDTNIVPATETGIQNQNGGAVDETAQNETDETTTEIAPTVNNSDLNGTGVKKTPSTKTKTTPTKEPEEEEDEEPLFDNKVVTPWNPQSKDKLEMDNFMYPSGTKVTHTSVSTGDLINQYIVGRDQSGVIIGSDGDGYKHVNYDDFERLARNGYYKISDEVNADEYKAYQNYLKTVPWTKNSYEKLTDENFPYSVGDVFHVPKLVQAKLVDFGDGKAHFDALGTPLTWKYDYFEKQLRNGSVSLWRSEDQNGKPSERQPISPAQKTVTEKNVETEKSPYDLLSDNLSSADTVRQDGLEFRIGKRNDVSGNVSYKGAIERIGPSTSGYPVVNARGLIYNGDWKKTREETVEDLLAVAKKNKLFDPKSEETAVESPSEKPVESADANAKAAKEIADWVKKRLDGDHPPFSKQNLQVLANNAYGGTQAQGAYTVKDMTDALELGINEHLISDISENKDEYTGNADEAKATLKDIEQFILAKIPTQTNRTEVQIKNQQFSTPPNIAFVANWVANIDDKDTVLEPSAGVGGLASFGKGIGAKVYVNEWDPRRLSLIKQLPFDGFYQENAEQIDNILPDSIKPTVVVMNPPFSANGRTKNNTKNAIPHIEQALERLQQGGRLVAILGGGRDEGGGMSDSAPSFKAWWNKLRDNGYDIKANIGIDGSNYSKYGTSFNVRLVVIDKTGNQEEPTLTGEYKDLSEVIDDLEDIRNDRQRNGVQASAEVQSNGSVKSSSGASESGAKPGGRTSGTGKRSPDSGKSNEAGQSDGSGRASTDIPSERGGGNSGKSEMESEGSANPVQVPDGERESGQGREPSVDGRSSESGERDERPGGMGSRESGGGTFEQSGQLVPTGSGVPGTSGEVIEDERTEPAKKRGPRKAAENDDGVYAEYRPADLTVKGAKKHPAKLVESSAMSAVQSPPLSYRPKLDQKLIESGAWSDAQLENIAYAGQAHSEKLPNGERKGYFVGDGTGVGKGRQIAGIIMDNFNQGRKKAIWISENFGLMEDAKRDWRDVGGDENDVFSFSDSKKKTAFPSSGIMFLSYDTLRSKSAKTGKSNLDLVEEWVGKDFDGVIIFDEAHNMGNLTPVKGARGKSKPAAKAIAGDKLQKDLPNARVAYFSATGATNIENLSYASRLGLWGEGTSFQSAQDFVSKIGSAGISAMELVARDMKAMGVYLARSISYDGVTYDSLNHNLTPMQVAMYDRMSEGWQVVLQNFDKAMEATGSTEAKEVKQRRAQAYSNMQMFYNQILTSMAMPSVIQDIEKELKNGHSAVIQLVNTNEAAQDREVQKMKEEGGDLDDLDITPRQLLVGYVENAFPIYQYEEYLDENGNSQYQVVTDSAGNPVVNKKALKMKEDLIADLNEISIPEGPLDMLINHFGVDQVAEVTGRSQRVVNKTDETGNVKKVLERRNSKQANIADAQAFQDGKKRILVFSNAGSTGRSFHADKRAKNQQKRVHYVLQPGWRADKAVQGFGRTHRSNQVNEPIFRLVSTDVKGHKRFVTSIARRLDQLGALTKGQRQTGSGVFGEKDNLESPLSVEALKSFYKKLGSGYYSYIDGDDALDAEDVLHRMGLDKYFYDEYGNFNVNTPKAGEITTFLNRLLALPVEEQNKVFDAFERERDKLYNEAIENGTLDTGLENVKADKIEIADEEIVYTDPKSGAETKYVRAKLYNKPRVVTTIAAAKDAYPGFTGIYRMPDGSVKAAYRKQDGTDSRTGEVYKQYLLVGPNQGKASNYRESTLKANCEEIPKSDWQSAWDEEVKGVPEYNENEAHMITGALLPIWNKLPQDGNIKARRIVASDGSAQYLGRIIPPAQIESVLRQLDVGVKKIQRSAAEIRQMIMGQGKEVTFNGQYGGVYTVGRKRVSNENRMEITGGNTWVLRSEFPDLIQETIQYQRRYFIPDSAKGEAILQKLIDKYGIRSIDEEANSGVYYSAGLSRGKWGKGNRDKSAEVKSINDLVDEAKRIFGIPINAGKMGPVKKSVQGIFKEQPETIRMRQYGDLLTIAHEIGHWYDKKYRLRESPYIKSVISEFQEDLEKAGYKSSQYPFESVAEYFREYLSDREATEQKFRQFTNWMYKTINPTDQRRLAEYSGMTNAYFAADLDRRASAQVHYRTDDNSVQKKAQVVAEELQRNPNEYLGGLSRDFVRAWFDDLIDLRGFGKTYDLAYYEKQARRITYGRLTSAMTDKHGNIVGKSLADILSDAKIDAKNARAFDEYLIARVALDHFEAKERGEDVGTLVYGDEELNNANSIAERIDTYKRENPTFNRASEELYEYQNHLLDLAVNSGLMDEDLKDRLNKLYPHYVPLYRVMDDAKQKTRGAKRGYADQNTPIARFKGSGRDIYSPIESIIQNTEKFTASCMRNDVMVEFANYIDNNEGMGWAAEKIPQAKILDYISTDELGKRLDAFRRNTDRLDKMTEEEKIDLVDSIMAFVGDTLSQWKPAAKQGKNVVSVMRGGKRSYYEVHDEGLYKALTNMDAPQYGFITRTFGAITRANKLFYTSSNPQFIFTNPQRDIVTGFISSTTTDNPVRYMWDFGKAYKDAIMNSAEYKEYMREGGGYMGSVTSNYNILKRVKKDVVKPDQGVIKNFLDHVVKLVPRLVDAGESASRLAEWKRAIAQGDDAMTAMRKAQEITVNFARGGRIVKEINQYVPFFMAGFNALAHNYDLFVNGGDGGGGRNGNNGFGLDLSPEGRKRRSKAWLKWLLTTGLLAFLTWLFNYIISPKITGESEEEVKKNYDDLSNYNKNAFYNLYIGDHKFFRVKKTQDMAIPSTIVERMVEYYVLDQKDSMNGLADFCMDQILPVNPFGGEDFVDCAEKAFSEVTLLGTVVDLARNKDFKGSPIVSKSYEYKEAEDQIKPTTSNIWVSVGKAIHASPIQLQYIAEDNFGWAARLIDSLTQANGERSFGIGNKLISDSVYSTDIINDLYDTRDEFEARKKKYTEHPDSDQYSNEDVLGYYKFSKATDLYSDLNTRIRAEGDNDIARDMKIQANAFVDTINKTGMTDLDKAVADIAESAGVDIKDIAPYIVTVDHIKTNGVEFPMSFDDMILYYSQAQTAFENAYGQILQSGYDDATSAAMMVQARKYIDSELKKAWKQKLVARKAAEMNE